MCVGRRIQQNDEERALAEYLRRQTHEYPWLHVLGVEESWQFGLDKIDLIRGADDPGLAMMLKQAANNRLEPREIGALPAWVHCVATWDCVPDIGEGFIAHLEQTVRVRLKPDESRSYAQIIMQDTLPDLDRTPLARGRQLDWQVVGLVLRLWMPPEITLGRYFRMWVPKKPSFEKRTLGDWSGLMPAIQAAATEPVVYYS